MNKKIIFLNVTEQFRILSEIILSELHKRFILLCEKHFPKPKSKNLVWFDG